MKRLPANQHNTRINRERDMRALSRLGLLLFCGAVLSGGFVFAAKQHFAAVKFGYNSEALRKEREQLLRENQQLSLEKEQASSPARLEAAARELGLKPLQARQVGTVTTVQNASSASTSVSTIVSRARTQLQKDKAKAKQSASTRR